MPLDVTLMIASVGCSILGSGTVSTRTSRLPWNVTAFIAGLQSRGSAGCYPLDVVATARSGRTLTSRLAAGFDQAVDASLRDRPASALPQQVVAYRVSP